jgi:hypothetical protein
VVAAVAVGVVAEAEVVAAVAVAAVVDDDASWRFEHVGNRKRLTWKRERYRDSDAIPEEF